MKTETKTIRLPEGTYCVQVDTFSAEDKIILSNIYKNWRVLSDQLISINSRAVNLPEGLSEGVFCIAMDCVRMIKSISGANTSWDCYNLESKKRIQVKACSVLPDLTSFGPASVWDELYFMDFFKEGKWNGEIDIYKIDNADIYNHKVNAGQTFKDQQAQGRRPRFSIYSEIIRAKAIAPVKTYKLFLEESNGNIRVP